MTTRAETLDAARAAVMTDRAATHGAPEDTFAAIAALWSARLGQEITSAQVCILLIDLKTARAWGNPGHADNWIDAAGYAACGGEVAASPGSEADGELLDLEEGVAAARRARRARKGGLRRMAEQLRGLRCSQGGSVMPSGAGAGRDDAPPHGGSIVSGGRK